MKHTKFTTYLGLCAMATLLLFVIQGCRNDSYYDGYNSECRFDPYCASGWAGAYCDSNRECLTDFCCTSKNCGGGMCTYYCHHDQDCPGDMLCEHETCFFACYDDYDCAEGQRCEHDSTVCEWNH